MALHSPVSASSAHFFKLLPALPQSQWIVRPMAVSSAVGPGTAILQPSSSSPRPNTDSHAGTLVDAGRRWRRQGAMSPVRGLWPHLSRPSERRPGSWAGEREHERDRDTAPPGHPFLFGESHSHVLSSRLLSGPNRDCRNHVPGAPGMASSSGPSRACHVKACFAHCAPSLHPTAYHFPGCQQQANVSAVPAPGEQPHTAPI